MVAREVQRLAGGTGQRWTNENPLLRSGAMVVAQKLASEEIRTLPLSRSPEALDELDRVLGQLKEHEAAQNRESDSVDSALKHAGEAHSIVNALRTQAANRTTLLLTNDGGAIKVARNNGVPVKHVGGLLRELGCEDGDLEPEGLYDDFVSITERFASVPTAYRPTGPLDFTCRKTGDGSCSLCPQTMAR
ncbi:hypothetical protein [Streptomyces sp. D54]|uniref:hypothetical protein n=1 Tax=Streptomyces sp. D54 TaxID=1290289 RepID=UPI003CF7554E